MADIINWQNGVVGKLDSEHAQGLKKEAIQLCRGLITRLDKPDSIVVDLSFSVSA